MGKSTISMAIFNSKLSNYQRVLFLVFDSHHCLMSPITLWHTICGPSHTSRMVTLEGGYETNLSGWWWLEHGWIVHYKSSILIDIPVSPWYFIAGWWFGTWTLFSISWECHTPNWLFTFFRGVGIPPTSLIRYCQPSLANELDNSIAINSLLVNEST